MNISDVSPPTSVPPAGRAQSRLYAVVMLLLVTGLAGCVSEKTLIRMGIFVAPLSTIMLAIMLNGHALRFPIFVADPYRRPWVLALPTIAITASNLFLWLQIKSTGQDTKELTQLIGNIWFGVSTLMMAGAYVITIIIWRIWLAFSPRTSYEGANILGPMLFFGPGVLYAHGIYTKELYQVIQWLTIYDVYAVFAFPVFAIAVVAEAWYRQRAQRSL
jgi:hypothetical protein